MKILSLFFILGFLSYNLAQDCGNPLLGIFNINGLPEPVSGQGLPRCSNLQNGQTCCSADTLNGLQSNLDQLSRRLEAIAASRDIYITQLRSNFSERYRDLVGDISDSDYDGDINRLQDNVPDVGNPIRNQTDLFKRVRDGLNDIEDSFQRAIIAYQERRTNCFTTLLQVQSSAWCLACDPNYANLGVQDDGTVNFDQALCDTIGNACGPFLDQGIFLNSLYHANQTIARLDHIKQYLDAYRDFNQNLPNSTIENDLFVSDVAVQRTVSRPEAPAGCQGVNCNWQCTNLFSPNFVLNEEIVGNGAGLIGGADITDLPPIGLLLIPPPETETEVQPPVEETETPIVEEVTEVVEETVTEVVTEVEETVTEVITEVEETVTEVVTEVEETVTEVITEVGETVTEVLETETTITQQGTGNRLLQTGVWNPDLNAAGFNIAVVQDPGQITNWDEGDVSDVDDADIDDHLAGSRVTITGTVLFGTVVLAALI